MFVNDRTTCVIIIYRRSCFFFLFCFVCLVFFAVYFIILQRENICSPSFFFIHIECEGVSVSWHFYDCKWRNLQESLVIIVCPVLCLRRGQLTHSVQFPTENQLIHISWSIEILVLVLPSVYARYYFRLVLCIFLFTSGYWCWAHKFFQARSESHDKCLTTIKHSHKLGRQLGRVKDGREEGTFSTLLLHFPQRNSLSTLKALKNIEICVYK